MSSDKDPVQSSEVRLYGAIEGTVNGATLWVWRPLRVSQNGILNVTLTNEDGSVFLTATAFDNDSNSQESIPTLPRNLIFNGGSNGLDLSGSVATWDRQRGNTEDAVLASAARTANTNSADFTNFNARGLHLNIDVSAIAATPSIVPTIQGKDPVSGNYYNLLVGPALTAVSNITMIVYPGIIESAGFKASLPLPRTWRVNMVHADADSITYSVTGSLIL